MDDKGKTEIKSHVREHLNYPATKAEIVKACNNMAHVPAEARKWVTDKLTERRYNSADDVLKVLGL